MPSYDYWWEEPQTVLLGGRLRRPRLQALQSGKRWRCEVTYYPKAGSKGERRLSSTHHSRREAAIAMESFLETFNTPKRLPAGTAKASTPPRLSLRETATGRRKKTDVRAAATSAVYTTKPTAPDLVAYERVRRELRWPRLTMLHWQKARDASLGALIEHEALDAAKDALAVEDDGYAMTEKMVRERKSHRNIVDIDSQSINSM